MNELSQSEKRAIRQKQRAIVKNVTKFKNTVFINICIAEYQKQKQHHAQTLQYWRF